MYYRNRLYVNRRLNRDGATLTTRKLTGTEVVIGTGTWVSERLTGKRPFPGDGDEAHAQFGWWMSTPNSAAGHLHV